MKHSRFKEIIREELALANVDTRRLREAPGDVADRRTMTPKGTLEIRAAFDALTIAWHKIGEAEDALKDDDELQPIVHTAYAAIGNQLRVLRTTYEKLRD